MLKETCFQWRSPAANSYTHSVKLLMSKLNRKLRSKLLLLSVPFLVRLRSSPPLETKFNAMKMFDSLHSPFSSAKANAVVP